MIAPTVSETPVLPNMPQPIANTQQRFDQLATAWISETAHFSTTRRKTDNLAFQEIVRLGSDAIPCLLRAIATRPLGHWYLALDAILGFSAAAPDEMADIERREQAWLRWGKENSTYHRTHSC